MKGASQIAPFGLRMPEELKEAIAERAKRNGRSMNAEIVQILSDVIEDVLSTPEAHNNEVKFKINSVTSEDGTPSFYVKLGEDGILRISGNVDFINGEEPK